MALTAVAADIALMKSRRVAMWGAGRIFDSLVVHGNFDARGLALLIDKHLKPLVPERHGCEVQAPEALKTADAGVVIVMSRSFAPEIADEARRLAPAAEILFYSDLLAQARTQNGGLRQPIMLLDTKPSSALPGQVPELIANLQQAARFVRQHVIASIYHAGSGHPGGALSCADMLACLYGAELNLWPSGIDDPARDRFVLSKGHAAPALYAVGSTLRIL